MSRFKDVKRILDNLTVDVQSTLYVTAACIHEDTQAIALMTPDERTKYQWKTHPVSLFVIIRCRLRQYGVDLEKASETNGDVRPMASTRLRDILAYSLYEYDQAMANESRNQASHEIWTSVMKTQNNERANASESSNSGSLHSNPSMMDLHRYATIFTQAVLDPVRFTVPISFRDADGIDDIDDNEQEDSFEEKKIKAFIPTIPLPF